MPRPADPDQRIAKLLARAGVASRREVERMIAEGRVALRGAVVDTPATILPDLAGVTVDGKPVEAPAPARLFLYHKPAGLLVTERDPGGRPTIYDRLPGGLPRVVPVGRLDLSTEGLLLLTTDGGLKRQLELPATGVERVYRARAYGQVSQEALEDLITGVEIEGVRYGPIDANLERRTGANVWIEMKLTEGKNREVRRVLDHLGLRVSRLIRTAYGPFVLGDLPTGEVAEVRAHDIASFRANPTRRDLPQPPRRISQRPTPVPTRAVPAEALPAGRKPARDAASPRPPRKTAAAGGDRAADRGGEGSTTRVRRPAPHGGRPQRDGASPASDRSALIAKPARAARARAHREATGVEQVLPALSKQPRTGESGRAARKPAGKQGPTSPARPPAAPDRPRPATGSRRPGPAGRAGPPTGRPPRRPGR